MAYILSRDLPHRDSLAFDKRWREQWRLYQEYLRSKRAAFRPATRDFALAPWHYDPQDHRCPHDAWLEHCTIHERVDEVSHNRSIEIHIRLLGAYHDGYIELRYQEVERYSLDWFQADRRQRTIHIDGHGDWQTDEIRFSERGKIVHEIEWANTTLWLIECNDIQYTWIDKDSLSVQSLTDDPTHSLENSETKQVE
jgi:hypothetical protein